jgi:Bacterial archaeo-eukaryotic release factor family 11
VLLHLHVGNVEDAISGVLARRNAPLVIAAEELRASMFRSVKTYKRLSDETIEGSPGQTTDAELEDAAIRILDRLYSRELKAVIALCDELKPRGATTDLCCAAHAATAGAADRHPPLSIPLRRLSFDWGERKRFSIRLRRGTKET